MDNNINIDDIISEHGKLYRPGSQNEKDILKMLKQPSVTESYFQLTPTRGTVIDKALVKTTRVLQAFQAEFTPLGNVSFHPNKIELQHLKIDEAFVPHELQASWLGFMAERGLDPTKMPITKFVQELLLEQFDEDLEDTEIFTGEPAAVVSGTPNPIDTNILGIRKQIRDGVAAGSMNSFALGAIPNDDILVVDYIEAFYESLPEVVQKKTKELFVSPALRKRFKRGMRQKYNTHYEAEKDELVVFDSSAKVVGLPCQTGSDMIWTTPGFNRARYTKNGEQNKIFDVQKENRQVKLLNDHWRGLGFWINEYVYCNDQDLV